MWRHRRPDGEVKRVGLSQQGYTSSIGISSALCIWRVGTNWQPPLWPTKVRGAVASVTFPGRRRRVSLVASSCKWAAWVLLILMVAQPDSLHACIQRQILVRGAFSFKGPSPSPRASHQEAAPHDSVNLLEVLGTSQLSDLVVSQRHPLVLRVVEATSSRDLLLEEEDAALEVAAVPPAHKLPDHYGRVSSEALHEPCVGHAIDPQHLSEGARHHDELSRPVSTSKQDSDPLGTHCIVGLCELPPLDNDVKQVPPAKRVLPATRLEGGRAASVVHLDVLP